jgi:hypothetical protein
MPVASLAHDLWDNAVGGAAVVALALGVWISARTLGLLNRPKYWLRATYLPPRDAVGFFAMPHFLIEYENRGNVDAVFSDFMLMLPRLEGVIDAKHGFVLQVGAEVFIDKRPTTTFAGAQEYKAIDYRTHRVRLAPGDSHTDFFDLGAFLPGAEQSERFKSANVPSDFSPVLAFHDSYGNNFYADTEGLHPGVYQYPHESEMMKGGRRRRSIGILSGRRWLRWLGWTQKDALGLGEEPPPV